MIAEHVDAYGRAQIQVLTGKKPRGKALEIERPTQRRKKRGPRPRNVIEEPLPRGGE